jgi:hypothetical protein
MKKKNNGKRYVTFQMKPCDFAKAMGIETKYYAVECNNDEEVKEIMSDVYSIDGVTYIRVNKGTTRMKGRQVLSVEEYKKSF